MKKVFISYSRDSDDQLEWVVALANELREKYGIVAELDEFININNLNKMMLHGIKNYDKIILVITESYTNKANNFERGVGRETELLLNRLQEDENSVIPIIRESCKLPFYISNYRYIDFKAGANDDNMEELVRRINEIPTFTVKEITKNPKKVMPKEGRNFKDFNDEDLIPDLKEYTDEDLDNFIEDTFKQMINKLNLLLNLTKSRNSNFDYEHNVVKVPRNKYIISNTSEEKIEAHIYSIYKNNKEMYNYQLWVEKSSRMMSKGIFGSNLNRLYLLNNNQNNKYDDICFNSYNFCASFSYSENKSAIKLSLNQYIQEEPKDGNDLAKIVFSNMMEQVKNKNYY